MPEAKRKKAAKKKAGRKAKSKAVKDKPDKASEDARQEMPAQPRPFWSGVIAFGLVSLPVSLFPASRGKSFSLKMVDDDGTPLRRRYFCQKEGKVLEADEIVRGYEIDEDRFVIIKDEELDALAPDKTREIDLRRFVPLSEINPVYFERGYFLAPDSGATKAYRLLARSMEEEGRAGIATFVMRNKEYIIAILAENGILRAETLRFRDELRSPADIGLPALKKADANLVGELKKLIRSRSSRQLDRSLLIDHQAQRTLDLVRAKLAKGTDVIEAAGADAAEDDEEETNVIDLMQVLKERLQGRKPSSKSRTNGSNGQSLESLSRDQLYRMATERDVPGRSRMNKNELINALNRP